MHCHCCSNIPLTVHHLFTPPSEGMPPDIFSHHCRYQDMVSEMKQIAALAVEQELTVEERNLLSVAYKNLVGARRASWRILQSVEQSEMAKGNEKRVKLIQKYRASVEKELDEVCGEILSLLDKYLVPSATTCEASVFYLKMKVRKLCLQTLQTMRFTLNVCF